MSAGPHRWRVLIVDDDPNARALQVAVLGALGHHVAEASSADEALLLLDAGLYDLLLSDVMMMRMDGIELARRVRRDPRHEDMPIVLVTALEDRETRIRCLEVANAVLVKPVHAEELHIQVGGLMRARSRVVALREQLEPNVHVAYIDKMLKE